MHTNYTHLESIDVCKQPNEVEGSDATEFEDDTDIIGIGFNAAYEKKEKACREFRIAKKTNISKHISKLMTMENKNDLILAVKSFGLNHFSNMQLQQDKEWDNIEEAMIGQCIGSLIQNQPKSFHESDLFLPIKESATILAESPCKNLTALFTNCEKLCKLQKNLTTLLTIKDIRMIMRYVHRKIGL